MLRNSVHLLNSPYLGLFLIAVFLDFDESLDCWAERDDTHGTSNSKDKNLYHLS